MSFENRFKRNFLTLCPESWVLKILTILSLISSLHALSGDHICSRVENYTLTSKIPRTYKATVKTYGWCFSLPPRCSKTRYETRTKLELKAENKTRTIYECCKGYAAQKDITSELEDEICLPQCKNCSEEFCISPGKCRCPPGEYKDYCEYDCPHGFWGNQCLETCDCALNVSCDVKNGTCRCPAGFQGIRCEEKCSYGRWGTACLSYCSCKDTNGNCHHETGECLKIETTTVQTSTTKITNLDATSDVSSTAQFVTSESKDRNTTEPFVTSESKDRDTTEPFVTSENKDRDTTETFVTEIATEVYSAGPEDFPTSMMDHSEITTQNRESSTSSTFRPVVVLVSVPERRNVDNSYSKISLKGVYLGQYSNVDNLEVDPASRIDYMKTFQKDVVPVTVPLEIVMIAVAVIVVLGLMAAAIVTVVHMRLKSIRCDTIRSSPYNRKTKGMSQERENGNVLKIPSITGTALPQTPMCGKQNFGILLETMDDTKTITYANEPTNIALHCLQESHYDKPPSTLISLQTSFNANTEHIYDEIPMLAPILSANQHKGV